MYVCMYMYSEWAESHFSSCPISCNIDEHALAAGRAPARGWAGRFSHSDQELDSWVRLHKTMLHEEVVYAIAKDSKDSQFTNQSTPGQ